LKNKNKKLLIHMIKRITKQTSH